MSKIVEHWCELPLERKRWITLFMLDDEEIASQCVLTNWDSPTPQLGNLFTTLRYRGRGYAAMLIQRALVLTTQHYKQALVLTVHKDNSVAEALYAKLGFRIALVDSTGARWMSFIVDNSCN